MIPKVKDWKVRYWEEDKIVFEHIVQAPNKDFAVWASNNAISLDVWKAADRRTVSVMKGCGVTV